MGKDRRTGFWHLARSLLGPWRNLGRAFAAFLLPGPARRPRRFATLQRLEARDLPSATPLGGEFRLNATVGGSQQFAANTSRSVAMAPTGNYVATWASQGQDGSGWGIIAQRYNAAGVAQGSEFQVNTTTAGDQLHPAVAVDGSGGFVITWASYGQDAAGTWGVYARVYNSAGVAQGSEILVNNTTTGNQQAPSVAMDSSGKFVISWTTDQNSTNDIYAQRFKAGGNTFGSEFRVNPANSANNDLSSIAMDASGDFVVVWRSNEVGGQQVFAQRFNPTGNAIGGEVRISAGGANQQDPAVAMDSNGNFTVAWTSNQGNPYRAIVARSYDSSGVALGSEYVANAQGFGDDQNPALVYDANGQVLLAWNSFNQDSPSSYGIYAQEYTTTGVAVGSAFPVNSTAAGNQQNPSVATDAAGHAVIVWSGNGLGDTDGVFAQQYATSQTLVSPGINVTGSTFLVAEDNSVLRINSLTGAVVATYSTGVANDGATFGPDGSLYVADYYNNKILHYDAAGTFLSSFGSGQLSNPQGVAFGPDGNLYVTNVNNTVQKYSPTGAFLSTFITAGSGGLSNAKGIIWGPDGNAYVASYFNSEVIRYNGTTGTFMNVFATGTGGFEDLTFGPDKNLYVASYGDNAVYRYNGTTGAPLGAFVSGSQLSNPFGLRFDTAGNLNVTNRTSGKIQTFAGTGAYLHTLATGLANPAYLTSTTSLVTTESGTSASFQVLLTSQPVAAVTINLATSGPGQGSLSQSTLTFDAGNWNVAQTVTVTGLDDGLLNGDQRYQITGTATSTDANYNGRVMASVSVVNQEADSVLPVANDDSFNANVNTPLNVAAPGVLGNDSRPPALSLTAVLVSGPTHGSVALNTNGSFTYTPAANYRGADSFTYRANDGLFNSNVATVSLTVSSLPPVAANDSFSTNVNTALNVAASGVLANDTDPQGRPLAAVFVTGPTHGSLTLNTDGSFTYTPNANYYGGDGFKYKASDGPATSAVATVSLTVNSLPPSANNDSYNTTVNTQLNVGSGVLVNDTDPQGRSLSAVLVSGPIHGTVTLAGNGSVRYTPAPNYAGPDSFTYKANDGLANSNVATVNLAVYGVAGVMVTPTSLQTSKAGASASFSVVLSSQPTNPVTINLSSTNPAEGSLSAASLTFDAGDWNVAQTVTVTGLNDRMANGDQTYQINGIAASADANYNGLAMTPVTVKNIDTNRAGFIINPTALTTSESGTTATFSVALATVPLLPVTVNLTNGNSAQGTLSQNSLTFTLLNWNVPQSVTVTGLDDQRVNGNQTYQINGTAFSLDLFYNGLAITPVTVINQEADVAGFRVTPTFLTTSETGASASFAVALTSQPSTPVIMTLATSVAAEGALSQASLTFDSSNWNVSQTVAVTGLDDHQVHGDQTYQINGTASGDAAYAGLSMAPVTVTNQEADTAGVTVTKAFLTTSEMGGSDNFGVALTSQPAGQVIVTLTSTNPNEGLLSQSTLTFDAGNWNTLQYVTVTGVAGETGPGDNDVFYQINGSTSSADANYAAQTMPSITVVNQEIDAAGITVVPTTLTTSEVGTSAVFSVVLTDQPVARVTIQLSSTDPSEGSLSQSTLVFTRGNWNQPQTVTVTGLDDHIVHGDQTYQINGKAVSRDSDYNGMSMPTVIVTNTEADGVGITVAPLTPLVTTAAGTTAQFSVALTSQPTAPVTIRLSSTDPGLGLPSAAALVFDASNWSFAQTVTVTGGTGSSSTGTVSYRIVSDPAVSADAHYNGLVAADVRLTSIQRGPGGGGSPAPVPEPVPMPVPTAPPAVDPGVIASTAALEKFLSDSRAVGVPAVLPTAPEAAGGAVPAITSSDGLTRATATEVVPASYGRASGSTPIDTATTVEIALPMRTITALRESPRIVLLAGPAPGRLAEASSLPLETDMPAPELPVGPIGLPWLPETITYEPAPLPVLSLAGPWDALEETHDRSGFLGLPRETSALIGTGILASTGYMLLNTRVGFWLLSLLTAKPLWKEFDPLEVLFAWENEQKKREKEDGETLVSLVE